MDLTGLDVPADNELEIVVFGPGFGECILLHIGSNKWIVVDSCKDSVSKKPVALEYLESIGIEPSSAVIMVLVTHWHDDHIRGIPEILEECPEALIAVSQAATVDQFIQYVTLLNTNNELKGSNGVREYAKLLAMLAERGVECKKACADRRLLQIPSCDLSHGGTCDIWSLAPSDTQIDQINHSIAALFPTHGDSKPRAIPNEPNNTSAVVQILIGDLGVLLGGDLEETSNPSTGWTAIVESTARPTVKCEVFKIPHHGSKNANNDDVWSDMLTPSNLAVVTPFNKGKTRLPTPDDKSRIVAKTANAYLTQAIPGGKRTRPKMVEKTLRDSGKSLRTIKKTMGFVRLRRQLGESAPVDWDVLCRGGATKLG